jgi:integrase
MSRDIVVRLSSNTIYWQADWKDSSGKRRKKSLGAKAEISRRQANKMATRLQVELNKRPGLADVGVAPVLKDYLANYVANRTDLNVTGRYPFELTGRYLTAFFGEQIRIDQITRQRTRDWRTALANGDFSEGRPMTEASVCRRCSDAKTIFKRATDDDLLSFNPFDGLKVRAPKPDKSWHYVTMDDLDKLLTACMSTGWKCLIALCRLAGLRRGEAMSLPWSAVDWQQRRLTIYASKTERYGGNRRVVPIVPKLYDILQEAFQQRHETELRVCDISAHCLWRNFTVVRKWAGLPAWDDAFQVMRRNCETDWAQRFPQYAVSEWIGHDITVSAIHYLAVTEELYEKASAIHAKTSIVEGSQSNGVNGSPDAPKSAPKPFDTS